jgi:hypothetical protein
MNVREWLSDRWHGRRDPRGDAGIDMAAIRALAREASQYDDLSEVPDPDLWAHLDTEGFSPSPAWGAGQVPFREPGQWDRRGPAEPWRHQWNVFEGGDLTPWLSPEERAAADVAAPHDGHDAQRSSHVPPVKWPDTDELTAQELDPTHPDHEHDLELGLE